MKRVLVLFFISLTFSISAQLSEAVLKFEPNWAYSYEQINLIGRINGASQANRVEMEIISLEGEVEIISQTEVSGFIYTQSTDTGTEYVETSFIAVPQSSERVVLQLRVKDLENDLVLESNTVTIDLEPQPDHLDAGFPSRNFANLNLRKSEIYQGEETPLLLEVFSGYNVRNMEDLQLNTPTGVKYLREADDKGVYIQGQLSTIYTVPLSVYSHEAGIYEIPQQDFEIVIREEGEYRNEILRSNSVELTVKEIPSYSDDMIVASEMKLVLDGYPQKVLKGEEVYFKATLLSDGCLDQVESLSQFFDRKMEYEEKLYKRSKIFDGNKIIYRVVFEYVGVSNSLVGMGGPEVEISFFNTLKGAEDSYRFSFDRINGDIHPVQFWGFIVIVLLIVASSALGVYLYIRKNQKKKGKKDLDKDIPIDEDNMAQFLTFVEQFNLTQREKDILKVLVEGKSTKDIADTLYISPETAKKHITNIMKKTQTHSRYEIYVLLNKHVNQGVR